MFCFSPWQVASGALSDLLLHLTSSLKTWGKHQTGVQNRTGVKTKQVSCEWCWPPGRQGFFLNLLQERPYTCTDVSMYRTNLRYVFEEKCTKMYLLWSVNYLSIHLSIWWKLNTIKTLAKPKPIFIYSRGFFNSFVLFVKVFLSYVQ